MSLVRCSFCLSDTGDSPALMVTEVGTQLAICQKCEDEIVKHRESLHKRQPSK